MSRPPEWEVNGSSPRADGRAAALGFHGDQGPPCVLLNPPPLKPAAVHLTGSTSLPQYGPFPSTVLVPRPLLSVARTIQVTLLAALSPRGLNWEV